MACSSKEQWKGKYGLYIEECSLEVREMQEPQEYAQTQVSGERRQRVLQAKKRYNCYTETFHK